MFEAKYTDPNHNEYLLNRLNTVAENSRTAGTYGRRFNKEEIRHFYDQIIHHNQAAGLKLTDQYIGFEHLIRGFEHSALIRKKNVGCMDERVHPWLLFSPSAENWFVPAGLLALIDPSNSETLNPSEYISRFGNSVGMSLMPASARLVQMQRTRAKNKQEIYVKAFGHEHCAAWDLTTAEHPGQTYDLVSSIERFTIGAMANAHNHFRAPGNKLDRVGVTVYLRPDNYEIIFNQRDAELSPLKLAEEYSNPLRGYLGHHGDAKRFAHLYNSSQAPDLDDAFEYRRRVYTHTEDILRDPNTKLRQLVDVIRSFSKRYQPSLSPLAQEVFTQDALRYVLMYSMISFNQGHYLEKHRGNSAGIASKGGHAPFEESVHQALTYKPATPQKGRVYTDIALKVLDHTNGKDKKPYLIGIGSDVTEYPNSHIEDEELEEAGADSFGMYQTLFGSPDVQSKAKNNELFVLPLVMGRKSGKILDVIDLSVTSPRLA